MGLATPIIQSRLRQIEPPMPNCRAYRHFDRPRGAAFILHIAVEHLASCRPCENLRHSPINIKMADADDLADEFVMSRSSARDRDVAEPHIAPQNFCYGDAHGSAVEVMV
jgi:hypothetical protein